MSTFISQDNKVLSLCTDGGNRNILVPVEVPGRSIGSCGPGRCPGRLSSLDRGQSGPPSRRLPPGLPQVAPRLGYSCGEHQDGRAAGETTDESESFPVGHDPERSRGQVLLAASRVQLTLFSCKCSSSCFHNDVQLSVLTPAT